jgi:anti-sigma regulatory factor (Ser/Thr protein kinase)
MNAVSLPLKMTILSQTGNLPGVREQAERICRELGFDDVASGSVMLSVDEALTNIIRHCYHHREDQRIDIEFTTLGQPPEALQIRLRDYGTFVDPSKIKSRDLADIRPGGLGVHIINNCMDKVQYMPAEGGGTELTLIKRIPSGVKR